MSIEHIIRQRVSANHFDVSRQISDAQLTKLIELAACAPSAYNAQNWRFIVIRDAKSKETLRDLAFGQSKVVEASANILIVGHLAPHTALATRLAPAVEQGSLHAQVRDTWLSMAEQDFAGKAAPQRDEAIRSASLAAMTLMLAAEGEGLATCPMSGFDAAGVSAAFGLSEDEIPVMLIPIGFPAPSRRAQKPRRALQEVLEWA
ncbi:nitroreductase family protein [Chitinibacteraceae bacterium HSL-7]